MKNSPLEGTCALASIKLLSCHKRNHSKPAPLWAKYGKPVNMSMRIATYNVNGVNGRLPRLLEWLRETSPDIVCLQELKTDDSKFPVRAIEDAGFGAVWHGQRAHHGVAILAKDETPREIRRGLPGDASDGQSRYLEAAAKGIIVASIYLPNGNPKPSPNFDYKLAWFERLNKHAASLYDSGQPIVLAGDFNVVPTDADIYNAWLWRWDAVIQQETRDAYQRLLAQGWTDATRYLHPNERIYTYWVNAAAFERNAGFRMDFLLVSAKLAPKLIEADVDTEHRGREHPSDHAPAWVSLSRTPSKRRTLR
ncbi:MAG TPA: exodeoxyribonuclease III [Rhizomicrobium sp.]